MSWWQQGVILFKAGLWAYPVRRLVCFDLGRVWIQTLMLRCSDSSPPRAVVWCSTTPLWTPTPCLWAPSRAAHHPTYRPTSWNCGDWCVAIVKGRWVRSVCLDVSAKLPFLDVQLGLFLSPAFCLSVCFFFLFECNELLQSWVIQHDKDSMCKREE